MRYELNKVNERDNLRMRFVVRGKFVLPVSCFYVSNASNPSVSLKPSTDAVLFFVLSVYLAIARELPAVSCYLCLRKAPRKRLLQ